MSAFDIKIIAIITMVIDHTGLFFFPQDFLFRIIGRLSFPLFAWLIANGARHTHNIKRYALRLIIFACISQIPFMLANKHLDPNFNTLNVLFTLFLGLIAIIAIKKTKNKFLCAVWIILAAIIAQTANTDYGYTGVFSIVAFYLFFHKRIALICSQSFIYLLLPIGLMCFQQITHLQISSLIESPIETVALFSLIFIMQYNKEEGPKTKYLFYIFYPLQYFVIYLLQILL
jgi:hypothetical protein